MLARSLLVGVGLLQLGHDAAAGGGRVLELDEETFDQALAAEHVLLLDLPTAEEQSALRCRSPPHTAPATATHDLRILLSVGQAILVERELEANGEVVVRVGDKSYSPQQLSAFICPRKDGPAQQSSGRSGSIRRPGTLLHHRSQTRRPSHSRPAPIDRLSGQRSRRQGRD